MSALRDLILDAWKQADHLLLGLCVTASLYGIVLIYSASQWKASMHSCPPKQLIALCIGIVLYFIMSQLNIDTLKSWWKLVLAGCTILIMMLLIGPISVSNGGNRAWLRIPGIPFNIQPAEVTKIFFAILLAQLLVYLKRQKKLNSILSVAQLCVLLFYFVGIIFVISKDAGTCLIYVFIFLFMTWGAGLSKVWFALGAAMVGAVGYVVWTSESILPKSHYWRTRILILADHDLDPLGQGFQQTRSMMAIRSGGLTGQGFLQGSLTQSQNPGSLTAQRNSDFIFATCAEEWGLLGCTVVICLLMAILLRCLYIGLTAPDEFSSLVCIGYVGMFIAQLSLNLGMCLFVMPVIGVTLPFFSYGGSSIITNFIIMGIVSGIKRRALPDWIKDSGGDVEESGGGVYLKPQSYGPNYKKRKRK